MHTAELDANHSMELAMILEAPPRMPSDRLLVLSINESIADFSVKNHSYHFIGDIISVFAVLIFNSRYSSGLFGSEQCSRQICLGFGLECICCNV